MKAILISTISIFFLFYFFGAFIMWKLNPNDWGVGIRAFCLIASILVSIIKSEVVFELKKKEK